MKNEKKVRLTIPWGSRGKTIRYLRAYGVIVSDNGRWATARTEEGERILLDMIRRGWGAYLTGLAE